ncbi:hypothetical protein ACEWY4_022538 [Coilia grayii]|uniref:Transport and Golgi organization protein 1 homolog n=1 Tax=Coilia grayii TaxID=363190 RepID=A0ABD1J837_9TELE
MPVSDRVSDGVAVPELKTTLGNTFEAVISDDEDTLKVTLDSEEAETDDDMTEETEDEQIDEPQEPPLLSYSDDDSDDYTEERVEEVAPEQEPEEQEPEEEPLLFDLVNHAQWEEHRTPEHDKSRSVPANETAHRVREGEQPHVLANAHTVVEQVEEILKDDADTVKSKQDKQDQLEQDEEEPVDDGGVEEYDKEEDGKENDDEEQDDGQGEEEQAEVVTSQLDTPIDNTTLEADEKTHPKEQHEKPDPTQPSVQPREAAPERLAEAISSKKITEREHDRKIIEQIAKAKKDITGITDSWGTEHVQPPSEDEEEPKDLEEDLYHEELLEDENAVLSSLADKQEESEEVAPIPEMETVGAEATSDIAPPPALSPVEADPKPTEALSTDESSNITDTDNDTDTTDHETVTTVPDEPEYSDSVLRLTLIRDHFKEKDMERFQKFLSLKHLLRIEAMFNDLDQELKSARLSPNDSSEDIERTLEAILESSETSILDEIEKILDSREQRNSDLEEKDAGMFDEEAAILDDFQELAFTLRQKYSLASDSVPLVAKAQQESVTEEPEPLEVVEESVNNLTVTEPDTGSDIGEEEQHPTLDSTSEPSGHSDLPHSTDLDIEEDGGHRNRDSQASPKEPEKIQTGPQPILENPLDVGFDFEVEHQSTGSIDHRVSDFHEDGTKTDIGSTSVFAEMQSTLQFICLHLGSYTEVLLATLPEEWRPGPTFHGLPWEPVVCTVAVGILTVMAFFWRTVLAVKSRIYQVTEKQLVERIQKMVDQRCESLTRISELEKQLKDKDEQLKDSKKSHKELQHEYDKIKKLVKQMKEEQTVMKDSIKTLEGELEAERNNSQALKDTISKSNKTVESLQQTITVYQKEVDKIQVLIDEAKLREDALKAGMMASDKENAALKEVKNSLQRDLREWEDKHKDLNEKIKVFMKSQKEMEDALAHKENEIDIMTDCIAELRSLENLETDDSHGDKALANGEAAAKRNETMKAHIKQMVEVSKVKATLSVIEDERNRFLNKLLDEEKTRQTLEEQIQKLEHDRSQLENEKTRLETQHQALEQKLEIMSEMYQQKETALHQKLTREELDRREKESKLSEVDRKTLKAEEESEMYKRRCQEMEDEMQKSERSFKAQIAALEKKAHDNWLTARATERALVEEKRESANLRQKLMVINDKVGEKYRHLPKPTPGRPDHPMRRGDSYGPSPVSGGAPSPPLMMEGPGRPPSAPVGRRCEPLGPRPPSDPHGRYADLSYAPPPRPDMYAPRTSSPNDGSISKSQGPGSLMVSPIRDSPAHMMAPKGHLPPPAPGHPGMAPAPLNGMPPPMIRPNGHLPMMPPGPAPHEPRFGPPPPLSDPRFGPPLPLSEPRFGPPVYGPRPGPGPAHPYGPPPPFMRGPPPPMRDYPPMPPDYPYPPRHLPPGAMLPPPGAMPPPPLHGERDFRGPPFPPHSHATPELRNCQGDAHSDISAKTDSPAPPAQQDPPATSVLDP